MVDTTLLANKLSGNWLTNEMTYWMTDRPADWLITPTDWLTDWVTLYLLAELLNDGWLAYMYLLIDQLADGLTDWLTGWLPYVNLLND